MKLRAAVIGVGYLGQFHAQKYKQLCDSIFNEKIQFVGVCDVNPQNAKSVAEKLQVQAFTDPSDLIGKVDLVTISTVTSTHYQLAKKFLENGVHVNVEKPITVTVEEAEDLVKLAKQKGLVLSVGHSERFNPAITELLKRKIEDVKWIELHRHAPFKNRALDVSVIHDLMIHDFDLLLALTKKYGEPEVVKATGDSYITKTFDWANVWLKFNNGLMAYVSTSRMASEMSRRLSVYSDHIYHLNLQTGDMQIVSNQIEKDSLPIETIQLGKGDNLLLETEAFIRAVLADEAVAISGEDGLRALKLVYKTIEKIGKLE